MILGHKTSTLLEPDTNRQHIFPQYKRVIYRGAAKGYGSGSGNSIPGYVPVDGFMSMFKAVKEIRRKESAISDLPL